MKYILKVDPIGIFDGFEVIHSIKSDFFFTGVDN